MIKFQCECGRKIAAPDQWLGKRVKCPQCGKPVLVQPAMAVAPSSQSEPMVSPPRVFSSEPTSEQTHGEDSATDHSSDSDASPDIGFGHGVHNEQGEHDEHHEPHDNGIASEGSDNQEMLDAPPMISPFNTSRKGGDYSGPATAPETHFFAPPASHSQGLPKPNVVPTVDPQHYYDDEASWGRWPRNFGIMSLLVGAVAAGLYFLPAVSAAGIFVAGAGALLALIGIVFSLRQDRAAFPWPAIALFVSVVAGGLPWLMPLIMGDPATTPSVVVPNRGGVKAPPEDRTEADKEARRRMPISVDSMLLAPKGTGGLATDVEYKLTNKTKMSIAKMDGRIQIYDVDSRPLSGLGLSIDFGKTPFPSGQSLSGRKTWSLEPRVRELLSQNQARFDYRADSITYVDGTQENFDR